MAGAAVSLTVSIDCGVATLSHRSIDCGVATLSHLKYRLQRGHPVSPEVLTVAGPPCLTLRIDCGVATLSVAVEKWRCSGVRRTAATGGVDSSSLAM